VAKSGSPISVRRADAINPPCLLEHFFELLAAYCLIEPIDCDVYISKMATDFEVENSDPNVGVVHGWALPAKRDRSLAIHRGKRKARLAVLSGTLPKLNVSESKMFSR
jgi:hypothetical protein